MAPRIIYTYTPSCHVTKAANTPDSPISIVANNVAFSTNIPSQFQNDELQDFVNYLSSCRLRYALADTPLFFYPKQVCEFYYSCTYSEATRLITGTVADDSRHVSISSADLRSALRLPLLETFSDPPIDAECKSLLPKLGYNEALQGNRPHLILRQCLPLPGSILLESSESA